MFSEFLLGAVAVTSIVTNYFLVKKILEVKLENGLLEKSNSAFEAVAAIEAMKKNPEKEEEKEEDNGPTKLEEIPELTTF